MDLKLNEYLERQIEFSRRAFGDGRRTEGICRHIENEVNEIRACPGDVMEWADVIILALDGAWRAGHTPEQISSALESKQRINMERKWPKPESENDPVEHDRDFDDDEFMSDIGYA